MNAGMLQRRGGGPAGRRRRRAPLPAHARPGQAGGIASAAPTASSTSPSPTASTRGCGKIFIATQYKAQSLNRHVRMGWSVVNTELGEFVEVLPPQKRVGENWYLGTADAVYQNLYSIEREQPRWVIILSGDHIYKMDYGKMLDVHIARGAALTVGAIEVPGRGRAALRRPRGGRGQPRHRLPGEARHRPRRRPGTPTYCLGSMGIYIFDTDVLVRELLRDAEEATSHDFGQGHHPASWSAAGERVYAYLFWDENKKESKYWRDVGTLDAYYEASMDLIQVDPVFNLYDPDWPLRTYQPQFPPAKFVFDEDGRRGIAVAVARLDGLHRLRQPGPALDPLARACACTRTATSQDSILMPERHHPPPLPASASAIVDREVELPRGRGHRLRPRGGPPPPHGLRGRRRGGDARRGVLRRPALAVTERGAHEGHDQHRLRVRPRDPGQPRQPHRRGRGGAGGRRHGPRGGSLGRLHRRARGGRAARRRQEALPRQGRAEGGGGGQRRASPASSLGEDALDQALDRPAHDRPRRHATPRAGWAPTRSWPSRWPWPRRRPRPPASRSTATSAAPNARTLPVPFMNIVNGGAHADNTLDPQEFMIVPHGAPTLRRGAAHGRRGVPPPEGASCKKKGLRHRRSATRAASRPTSSRNEEALETILDAISAAGLQGGRRRSRWPSTSRPASCTRARSTSSRSRAAPRARPEQMVAMYEKWVKAYPHRLDRGRPRREGLGGLEGAHRGARRDSVQLVGDDLFVTNPKILAEGIAGRRRQLGARQGQPDRHAHRDARLRGPGRAAPATPA